MFNCKITVILIICIVSCIPSSVNSAHSCGRHSSSMISTSLAFAFKGENKSKGPGPGPTPINPQDWPNKFPAKEHCSKCGLCETSYVQKVTSSCAFLNEGMARIDDMEQKIHGSSRIISQIQPQDDSAGHEHGHDLRHNDPRFGVMEEPMLLATGIEKNAQWTGVVTGIAMSMLESGMVDAVVCIVNGNNENVVEGGGEGTTTEKLSASTSTSTFMSSGAAEPQPILAKTTEDLLRGRGVKPALAPSLRVLDEIKADPSISKLLFCGVGCSVQAFRSIQDDPELGLERVYVLGTNCADNSPSQSAARDFIQKGTRVDDVNDVLGYEFMQDFKVHVKKAGKWKASSSSSSSLPSKQKLTPPPTYEKVPYFSLPGTIARASIADSCLACFDYTNALADVVVGYMGAPLNESSDASMDTSYQTLTIRNKAGKEMVDAAIQSGRINLHGEAKGSGSFESFAIATVESDSIVMEMLGKQPPENGMPRFVGNIVASIITRLGPKGTNFARYSIDYHLLRNYLHVLHVWGERRAASSLPQYAKDIVDLYMDKSEKFRQLKEDVLKHPKK